ncbi:hypothetical protein PL1_1794 [Paenibacillus larvae subsp. larvae B-3650]|nr:hypothetical protein PL1_1794 [Paenibacillus larvae subsp. larvae B-3650]
MGGPNRCRSCPRFRTFQDVGTKQCRNIGTFLKYIGCEVRDDVTHSDVFYYDTSGGIRDISHFVRINGDGFNLTHGFKSVINIFSQPFDFFGKDMVSGIDFIQFIVVNKLIILIQENGPCISAVCRIYMNVEINTLFSQFLTKGDDFVDVVYLTFFCCSNNPHYTKNGNLLRRQFADFRFQFTDIHTVIMINVNRFHTIKACTDNVSSFQPGIMFRLWN